MAEEAPTKAVPAVGKCLAIIRALDAEPEQGLGLAAVAARLELTKSHALGILRTLVAEGWVAHDRERQRYALAPGLLLDLAATLRRHDRGSVVRDVLERLAAALGLPCLLCRVNRDGSFTCVDRVQGGTGLMINVPVGHRYPPDAPSQMRARLAALPEARARAALDTMAMRAFTPSTRTDKEAVWAEVQEARRRGYAVGRMEYLEGVMSIAVGIPDEEGVVRLVLQCTGPRAAMEPREAALGEAITEAAGRIGLSWGMRGSVGQASSSTYR
ncbi:IclR family transcriptional regulator [Pararoseomonas indoligenes]|uniref:IclR family transcriptional regulator n=1 Tax=Roseomonas indoligenes TaxID=2820811 RepID=A0A940N4B1_9PROT|nr:IclR family transcriptional regulator [Pararoseomonas indoligenes]